LETPNGYVLGVHLQRLTSGLALASVNQTNVTELHKRLGHPGEERLRATAHNLNMELTGNLKPCEDCAVSKARQKNILKVNTNRSKIAGERLYIDLSGIKARSLGGSKYWVLIVDDATGMKWSYFIKTKDQLAADVIPFLQELKAKDPVGCQVYVCKVHSMR